MRPNCLPKSIKLRSNIRENGCNDNFNIKKGTNVVLKQVLRTHQAKYGFNNNLIFKASGQIKLNDKAVEADPSIKSQTQYRELTGLRTDISSDLCKTIESAQAKLFEKMQPVFKEQRTISQQQEQIRQLQRAQDKQFER